VSPSVYPSAAQITAAVTAAAVIAAAAAAGAALVESITNAVYEVLLSPVVVNLKTLPGLKEWTAAVGGQSSGVVTGAGEGE